MLKELIKLHSLAFNDNEKYISYFLQNVKAEKFIQNYKGTVASALYCLNRMLIFNKQKIPVSFISGVASLPEYRGKGLASANIKNLLTVLNNRKIPFAFLVPEPENFYQKFNFVTVSKFWDYDAIKNYSKRKITLNDIPTLIKIHNSISNCYIARSEEDFTHRINEMNLCQDEACILGDDEGYLFGGKGEYELVLINKERTLPFAMARICNVKSALLAMLPKNEDYEKSFTIYDPIIAENNQTFLAICKNGELTVSPHNSGGRIISIEELTKSLFHSDLFVGERY